MTFSSAMRASARAVTPVTVMKAFRSLRSSIRLRTASVTSTGDIDLSRIACAIAVAPMSAISLTELLLDHPASAVDQKALTGDEPRLIAGKKGHRSRDIFRLANKPYRRIGLDPINDFGGHGVMSAGSNCTG